MIRRLKHILFFICMSAGIISCRQVDVHEKITTVPAHKWIKKKSIQTSFDIPADTIVRGIYCIIRHTEKYPYNNLLATLVIKDTAHKKIDSINVNLPLTDAHQNWRGNKMDDLHDHKIFIQKPLALKRGRIYFIWKHDMPEDTLSEILNIGIGL